MFEFIDGSDRIGRQNFGCILVGEVIAPLDRIVHVPFPRIRLLISQSSPDASLGGPGMRPGGKDLGDQGYVQSSATSSAALKPARPDPTITTSCLNFTCSSPRLSVMLARNFGIVHSRLEGWYTHPMSPQ